MGGRLETRRDKDETPVTPTIGKSMNENSATIHVSGRFSATNQNEFRARSSEVLKTHGSSEIRVDLSAVDYIDSSALGMLLVLRDKATANGGRVVLNGASGSVK
jgi:anti-anti-sigma factor